MNKPDPQASCLKPEMREIRARVRMDAVTLLATIAAVTATPATATSPSERPKAAPFTTEAERCIIPAATYHVVNPYVLRAILKVESNLNPKAIGRNSNGTVDVGVGQLNSAHFKDLENKGVKPADLMDACVATYVSAWHLSKLLAKHGNTWEAIARYHSGTPYFNRRYQALLNNELVRSGVLAAQILPIPPLQQARQDARTKEAAHGSVPIASGSKFQLSTPQQAKAN